MSHTKYFNFGKGSKFVPPTKQTEVKPDETLAVIRGAALAISKARTMDDTILLKAVLDAAQVKARKQGLHDLEKEVIDYKFLLQDKTGEIIEDLKQSGQLSVGRPEKSTPGVQLNSLGISRNESSKAQKFHKLPAEKKTSIIETEKAKVGKKRQRRKIIEASLVGKITGKPLAEDHLHVFIYCDCGEKQVTEYKKASEL
jgi:hypothetical protein